MLLAQKSALLCAYFTETFGQFSQNWQLHVQNQQNEKWKFGIVIRKYHTTVTTDTKQWQNNKESNLPSPYVDVVKSARTYILHTNTMW